MGRKQNQFAVLTISVLLVVLTSPVKVIDDSLLLYHTFDSDTGEIARDATGKTKGGKIIGGTKVIPSGAHARALELNGTSGFAEIELNPEMIEAERDSSRLSYGCKLARKASRRLDSGLSGLVSSEGLGRD